MSTPAPAPGRRFRTMIRRKLAITAGAVLVGGALVGGALAAAPARASSLPDTVQLLGIDTDNPPATLYHNIHNADNGYQGWNTVEGNGGSQYFDVGGYAETGASIAALPDGSTQSVAFGIDDNLYFNIRYANGTWQGWQLVEGLPGSLSQPFVGFTPSIAGMPDGSAQIVEQQYGGDLYHNIRYANGTWQGWRPLGGPDGSEYYIGSAVIASLPDGSSQVFTTTDQSDATWENTRAGNGSWSGWTLLNGYEMAVAAAGWGALG
jgi:hypothetical protein